MARKDKKNEKLSELQVAATDEFGLGQEDPLERLLDEESDEDFGSVAIRSGSAIGLGEPVRLAEWTARDFSSIYVRFRPHLERHARRFLSNPSQIDEVVQDAFLYLMVSLPELDSEIGVLRFLKWKTRLLALDVIRATGRAHINSIDDFPEPESAEPEISSRLEQQDDAAVVKLALSKLNPRHREVLIASMYEEKSIEQISKQVSLSENATRQLIFRARAAFKKALVGDVDTNGMSASAILSVAARKAAAEGKKIGAAALTLVALVIMSLTAWPTLNRNQENNLAGSVVEPDQNSGTTESSTNSSSSSESPISGSEPQGGIGAAVPSTEVSDEKAQEILHDEENLKPIYDSGTSPSKVFQNGETYTLTSDSGVTSSFNFNRIDSGKIFSDLLFTFELSGVIFTSKPASTNEITFSDSDGNTHFVSIVKLASPIGLQEEIWNDSPLALSTVRIEIVKISNTNQLVSATISITPDS